MIEINGKSMCSGCFKELDSKNGCDCGFLDDNPKDSLTSGTILNGRYVVGKQIRENKIVKEYLCYDSQNNNTVLIKEFFPEIFVLRSSETSVTLENEDNLDAYNASMQRFIKTMQIPQSLTDSQCFIKVQGAFYENNTAYYVIERHSVASVFNCVSNNVRISDKRIVSGLYSAVKGLCELESLNVYNGNISAKSVYLEPNSIKIDGFEPNEDDFTSDMKDSLVFSRTSYYMSASDFSKKGKDILSDVFSVGAVLYAMLTGKEPESPFEGGNQFDKNALENSTNEKMLVNIIEKMCRIDSCGYESINQFVSDSNKLFKKYGLKEIKVSFPETPKSSSGKKGLIAIIAVAAVVIMAVSTVSVVMLVKKKTGAQEKETVSTSDVTEITSETTEETKKFQIDENTFNKK